MPTSPPPNPNERTLRIVGGVFVAASLIGAAMMVARPYATDALREREVEALRASFAVAEHEDIVGLERDLGFSRADDHFYPQVSQPEGATAPWWHAAESDGAREPELTAQTRGLVIEWTPDGGLAASDINLDLPETLRARSWGEVGWIAFAHPQTFDDAWEFDALLVSVERVDVRLVWRPTGRLLARGTGESLPPTSTSNPRARYALPAGAGAEVVQAALARALEAPDEVAPPVGWDGVCPEPPASSSPLDDAHVDCDLGATRACLDACARGSAGSCVTAAYAVERNDADQARALYGDACRLGIAKACANFGVGLARFGETEEALACAYRLFAWACAQDNPYGCGMQGRALAVGSGVVAAPELATALLRRWCASLGHFACDTLGTSGAWGELPEVTLEESQAALTRACETGYAPSCEETATELRAEAEAVRAAEAEAAEPDPEGDAEGTEATATAVEPGADEAGGAEARPEPSPP